MAMSKKVLYFDVETTGIDKKLNEIVQLAYIIEVDGEVKVKQNIRLRPTDFDNISPEALQVTGLTIEQLKEFPDARTGYGIFLMDLGMFCDKFNGNDKYYPAGYNVNFDLEFLSEFFKKMGDPYLGSWINWRTLDVLSLVRFADFQGKLDLPNHKLGTLCEHYGIGINAHDALSDIEATRELFNKLTKN